jgi:hypothetical protein
VRTRALAATALALSFFASTAYAQKPAPKPPAKPPATAQPEPPPPPPPSPPGLSETLTGDAKADYESGKLLFGDGDAAGALVKFKSAYEKSKDPRLLWNVAACEKNLRHYSKALPYLRQYLAEGGARLTDQDKKEAEELIKAIEPLTTRLKLDVNEPGAEVFIDDERVGTTPIGPLVVDIGSRKIRVHKQDFEEVLREVQVAGGAEMPLEIKLARIVHEGRINVRAPADATIEIDGKTVGVGTWSGTLPSGGHTLRVTAQKKRPYQTELYLQDKESREVGVTLEAEPSKGLPAWAWIAGGVVVVGGLTTAGILIFKPEDKYEGPSGNLSPGIVQANRPIRW